MTICSATIDLSNADLTNFHYFRLPGEKVGLNVPNAANELGPLEKTRAVYTYFRNLLLGHPSHSARYIFVFDPEKAKQLRPLYQRQFGKKGENLVALIGQGYPRDLLEYYGAVGKNFERF